MMRQYRSFFRIFGVYWMAYGGTRAVISSPYLHVSIFAAAVGYPLWYNCSDWAGIALSAIPNILGFSIGAFAVILSFGQESLERMKNNVEADSVYLSVTASFVHFIIVQTIALLIGVMGKAWPGRILGFVGTALTIYAIALAVAAAFRLFRLARVYNQMKKAELPPASPRGEP